MMQVSGSLNCHFTRNLLGIDIYYSKRFIMKLEQLLQENMRRFNTKNLNEQDFNDLENPMASNDTNMEHKKINWRSLEFDGIDTRDYPDFTDAYVVYAEYEDGTELSDEELERLDIHDDERIYDALMNRLRG
jgi:hypothetical protein